MRRTDTVIIGGGQAGLAMSRCLTDHRIDHVVLERGRIGERWRSERWDSLRLLTPNWMTRLPAHCYEGDDPDGYMTAGEVVGLLGPNGAGKTTSFYMIVGLVPADEGVVMLNDEEITHLPMHVRARRGIGYLAQEPSVFRRLTVEDNLLAILETRKELEKSQQQELCDDLLRQFGLSALRESLAMRLSGGERRRLEIARSLTMEPAFILLDEPFAGIDPLSIADIQSIIKQLASE